MRTEEDIGAESMKERKSKIIAVSLPRDLFNKVEEERWKLKMNRSNIYAEALRQYIQILKEKKQ